MKLTIERVRALLAAATPGPWDVDADGCLDVIAESPEHPSYVDTVAAVPQEGAGSARASANAAMIAAAPDLAADLLDAHAALATERERAEAAEADVARLRGAAEVRCREARAEADALRQERAVLIAERADARMMARCGEENWHAAIAQWDALAGASRRYVAATDAFMDDACAGEPEHAAALRALNAALAAAGGV